MRYAIVENGVVKNVIVWDGVENLKLRDGAKLIRDEEAKAEIGSLYDGLFVPGEKKVKREANKKSVDKQVELLRAEVDELKVAILDRKQTDKY